MLLLSYSNLYLSREWSSLNAIIDPITDIHSFLIQSSTKAKLDGNQSKIFKINSTLFLKRYKQHKLAFNI